MDTYDGLFGAGYRDRMEGRAFDPPTTEPFHRPLPQWARADYAAGYDAADEDLAARAEAEEEKDD